ncbi:MAG: DUF4424 family protein [Alphaproteobacteria bacterium]|nr:DUF4424 family protein [Alphaproteobacteria bacterium]
MTSSLSPRVAGAGVVAVLACALALAPAARANDSSAELKAGGLVLAKTDAIVMASEDLFVSKDKIRVVYEFENVSGADVTTTVAFPLPDLPAGEEPIDIPNVASDNFVNFATTVDGAPVALSVEQRAFIGDREITDLLKANKIPLSPRHPDVNAAVLSLPEATRAALAKDGVVERQDYDAGRGWEVGYTATWTLKTKFFRTQTFPAGRRVRVEHSYQPVAGYSVGALLALPKSAEWAKERAEMVRAYCVDATFERAITRKLRGRKDVLMPEVTVGYVLKTGANWAGPIRQFRLVVDKGAPENLVSFCATGVTKIGPTRYEVRKTNFTPTEDLNVLILQAPTPN